MHLLTQTPAHAYARRGDLRCLRAVSAAPDTLDQADVWGDAPLNLAASCPRGAPLVRALLDRGADPNHAGQFGLRPCLNAIAANSSESATLLAARGGGVDAAPLDPLSARRYLAGVFGLDGYTPWGAVDVGLTGALPEGVYAPLAEAFAAFVATPAAAALPAALGQRILQALRQAPIQADRPLDALVADLQAGLPVILPTGWRGHATTHVFLGDAAMAVDRASRTPLALLWLPNAAAVRRTAHAVLACRNSAGWRARPRLACLTLRRLAPRHAPLRRALTAPLCKPLKTGNCVVASAKGAVLALLLLAAPDATPASLAWARGLYKAFTGQLRAFALAQAEAGPQPHDLRLLQRCRERLQARQVAKNAAVGAAGCSTGSRDSKLFQRLGEGIRGALHHKAPLAVSVAQLAHHLARPCRL